MVIKWKTLDDMFFESMYEYIKKMGSVLMAAVVQETCSPNNRI